MVEFSTANAADFIDDDEDEPGEEIESAPPLQIGEERQINSSGLKKKLIKDGVGWETPEFGDEVTVHYVGKLIQGAEFISTRNNGEALTFNLGHGEVVLGLNEGIITMRKGETALFTVPPELGYGSAGSDGVLPDSVVQFEVVLISWITVVDVCKDGGIIKKVIENGEEIGPPGDLDEVRVKYIAMLDDDTIVAKTSEEGLEFYIKDGHLCPALPKAIKTMKRGEKVKLIIQPKYALGERKDNTYFSSFPQDSVLRIDLELVSFKPVIDVSGDSKVLKKILKEGAGAVTASEGAVVTVRYTAMLEDGTVFERKGFDGSEPIEFVTDEEQVPAGLDRAAMTMKKGECALLTVEPAYRFGSTEVKEDLATVPPCSTIIYQVEMLDFVRERAPWEMSNKEKIEAATRKKEEGNLLFKNGKYQRAGKKYDKAVDHVAEDESFGADDLRLREVLGVEFSNVKALYLRAQAYMETADLHLAELDIKKALETDPQNREVKLLQKNLKQLQAERDETDAKLYTSMFSCMTKDSSPTTKRLKVDNAEESKPIEEVIAKEMEKTTAYPDDSIVVDSS